MKKSSKQRRSEIRAERIRKARKEASLVKRQSGFFPWEEPQQPGELPAGTVAANLNELAHNNTYGPLPHFYRDLAFRCAHCGSSELWTAKQQRWWYEIAKGDINSTAKYCRPCRNLRRKERDKARTSHFKGLIARHGIRDAAKLLQKSRTELECYVQEAGNAE